MLGNLLLQPWGCTEAPVANVEMYKEIGNKINDSMKNTFRVQQSSGLYPAAGESDDCQHSNGIVTFTFEVGKSFQPDPTQIKPMCEKVGNGNLTFIDEILTRYTEGTLPERV